MKTFDYDIRQIKPDEKGQYHILETLKKWGAEGWQLVCGEWHTHKFIEHPQANSIVQKPIVREDRIFEAIIMKECSFPLPKYNQNVP